MELTEYQVRILRLAISDMSVKEIAQELGIYTWMLTHHLTKIYRKTGVSGRRELKRWATDELHGSDIDAV
jgi:DNA-binding CsgD family transcriptional regulator